MPSVTMDCSCMLTQQQPVSSQLVPAWQSADPRAAAAAAAVTPLTAASTLRLRKDPGMNGFDGPGDLHNIA
jgi:hypothetical protein